MIDDAVEGLLVPAGSDDALASELQRVLSDRGLAGQLSEAAARRVRSEFGLEAMIDRFEHRFASLVARSRRGGTGP
jgi:glycosyltransferase involved in cell wall biosynthesis